MKLSEHFTLRELMFSQTATRRRIDNTPPPEAIENLERLCHEVLEPLRNVVGKPLFVTSGYRCPKLNALVGGAEDSDHLRGLAADVVVKMMSAADVALAARALASFAAIRQVILEYEEWTHVSVIPRADMGSFKLPQPEFLVATYDEHGDKVYLPMAA